MPEEPDRLVAGLTEQPSHVAGYRVVVNDKVALLAIIAVTLQTAPADRALVALSLEHGPEVIIREAVVKLQPVLPLIGGIVPLRRAIRSALEARQPGGPGLAFALRGGLSGLPCPRGAHTVHGAVVRRQVARFAAAFDLADAVALVLAERCLKIQAVTAAPVVGAAQSVGVVLPIAPGN